MKNFSVKNVSPGDLLSLRHPRTTKDIRQGLVYPGFYGSLRVESDLVLLSSNLDDMLANGWEIYEHFPLSDEVHGAELESLSLADAIASYRKCRDESDSFERIGLQDSVLARRNAMLLKALEKLLRESFSFDAAALG